MQWKRQNNDLGRWRASFMHLEASQYSWQSPNGIFNVHLHASRRVDLSIRGKDVFSFPWIALKYKERSFISKIHDSNTCLSCENTRAVFLLCEHFLFKELKKLHVKLQVCLFLRVSNINAFFSSKLRAQSISAFWKALKKTNVRSFIKKIKKYI